MEHGHGLGGFRALGVVALLGVLPAVAAGQSLSTPTLTNSSSGTESSTSNCKYARRSSVTQTGVGAAAFVTRYIATDAADNDSPGFLQGTCGARTETLATNYSISFTATAPNIYTLTVQNQRVGDLNTRDDGSGTASADISASSCSLSNATAVSGSCGLADPGGPVGPNNANLPFNQSSTGTFCAQYNGTPVSHALNFQWTNVASSAASSSDEAAVRLGDDFGLGSETASDYPGTPSRDRNNDGHFVTVTIASLCGNGVVDTCGAASEQCDDGALNGTAGSCCATDCRFKPAGTTCRAKGFFFECDVADACTGASAVCPDNKAPAGTACTDDGNPCTADVCDGVGNDCTHPAGNAGAACADDGNVCTTDLCNGVSTTCQHAAGNAGTQCRASAGVCDVAEVCDGTSPSCPANGFQPSSVECRASNGVCDLADFCTGSSAACPADAKSTALCRGVAGVCDVADYCDGVNDDCPADSVAGAFVTCRASTGACDGPETCDGVGVDCPPDQLRPSGYVCRAAGGVCDVAEVCDGVGINCPSDEKSTAICRPASGPCDIPDYCDGISNACGADSVSGAFVTCRPAAGFCDVAENCDGVSKACQADGFKASTVECRASAGVCDPAESCTGGAALCPPDAKSTAVCRAATDLCDAVESCDGVANACPADADSPSTQVCRPAVDACDVAELCPGTGKACPPDAVVPDGDGDGACDAIDVCPVTPDPGQVDTDGDGRGDLCDPCTAIDTTVQSRAKLTLLRVAADPGDDRLKFTATFYSVVPTPPVDPQDKGVRFILTDSLGIERVDFTIPGGVYDPVARVGWLKNGAGTAWTYRNTGSVPKVNGISKVSVKKAIRDNSFKFRIQGLNGDYTVPVTDLPILVTVIFDPPAATTGQCGEAKYVGGPRPNPTCKIQDNGSTIKCK